MGVVLLIGIAVVGLALYVADRLLKARARGLRRRDMNDRLVAVADRVTEEQEQRHAEEQASAALTSFMPAIQRPPSSLPGVRHAGRLRAGRDHADRERGKADRESRRAGRRAARSGEHPVRPADHARGNDTALAAQQPRPRTVQDPKDSL